jgi:hypothetical protein
LLQQWAEAIDADHGPLVAALTADTGRRGISRVEVEGTVRLIRRWAERAPRLIERELTNGVSTAIPTVTARTRLVPYPLVGVISPWNFPLTLATLDAVPALAAGCAVVVKPSEVTPRFIRPLMATVPPELPLAMIEGDGKNRRGPGAGGGFRLLHGIGGHGAQGRGGGGRGVRAGEPGARRQGPDDRAGRAPTRSRPPPRRCGQAWSMRAKPASRSSGSMSRARSPSRS